MRLIDCIAEMGRRVKIDDPDAYLDDLRRVGLRDGPALQDAFDSWASTRKGRFPPTPREFADNHYVQRSRSQTSSTTDTFEAAMERHRLKTERQRQERRAALSDEQRDDEDAIYRRAMDAYRAGANIGPLLFGKGK